MGSLKLALQVDDENPDVGDLYLEHGTMRLTNTLAEEVAQQLFVRFKFWLGDWFLDRTQGTPYLQSILGLKTPTAVIEQIFKTLIITCPGVSQLLNFSFSRLPSRVGALSFTCLLADGTTLKSSDFGAFVLPGGV